MTPKQTAKMLQCVYFSFVHPIEYIYKQINFFVGELKYVLKFWLLLVNGSADINVS